MDPISAFIWGMAAGQVLAMIIINTQTWLYNRRSKKRIDAIVAETIDANIDWIDRHNEWMDLPTHERLYWYGRADLYEEPTTGFQLWRSHQDHPSASKEN